MDFVNNMHKRMKKSQDRDVDVGLLDVCYRVRFFVDRRFSLHDLVLDEIESRL